MKKLRDQYPLCAKVKRNVLMASGETVLRGREFRYAKLINNGEPRVWCHNAGIGGYYFKPKDVKLTIA